jgi:hypothetical protein
VVRAANASFSNAGLGVTTTTSIITPASVTALRYNDEDEEPTISFAANEKLRILAKYPGDYGNKIKVGIASSASISSTAFATTFYSNLVDRASLETTEFVVAVGMDDDDGNLQLLESFIVSASYGAKNSSGENIYFEEYIGRNSKYITAYSATTGTFTPGTFEMRTLVGGTVSALTAGNFTAGYDKFANPEEFDINLLVDCHNAYMNSSTVSTKTIQDYVLNICSTRLDCFAILTVPKTTVVGAADPITDMVNYTASVGTNSYGAIYGNWKYQYDSYADKYRWIPMSGDMAGIYARNDATREVWFAPAGFNRGGIKNVSKFAVNPNKAQRDILYKNRINPIVNFPGDGPTVFGQKTLQVKPSAFDRVSIRRLFIYMEKAISTASKYFLFEKNTPFTRRLIAGMINPFLADIKGKEGLTDYLVVVDETNNTGEVIDRNELVCDIYIKPARDVEFMTLNFIATKTGVSFTELLNR